MAAAAGYFGYFGSAATPLQPGCRSGCRGWCSYDLSAWHIVVLNTECGRVGGCTRASPQGRWLAADLAASQARCTLAYRHRPRWQDNIRQFIVGTGGKGRHGLARTPPRNAQARTASTYGVLALTLRPDGYDWRFVPEAGRSFTDVGSHPCQ